jgi:cold shock CspA family protein
MKDLIISAYLKEFCEQYGFAGDDEAFAFECFVNFCLISRHHPSSFDPDDVAVGGGGDLGIDGIGILVNDHLVRDTSTVDYLTKQLRRLDAQFVLLQAKTSAHFDSAEIGAFISGVRQFFAKQVPASANTDIRELHRIKNHIFGSSIHMESQPICRLYYATTGIWRGDPALTERVEQGLEDIRQTGLFSKVEFVPIDGELLKKSYREINNRTTQEFVFEKHTILPQISGVQEAYIGIVPCTEYLRLLCDDSGALNRRLFYDNVRDFQGLNPVNSEIRETLVDGKSNDRFGLLNNGVTIVARDVNKVGATFKLKDYQVVNGCQTSHILYLNKDQINERVFIPLKLIVTNNSDVIKQVVQGTNRQTEVKLEAFESLAPFQKKLEELYVALGRDSKRPLFFERRSKQHAHLEIDPERLVTLASQINCFLAMFLNEPHSTHRYYGELLRVYGNKLFVESHSLAPYFTAATALACVEHLFARGILARGWKHLKYQLLMIFRLQNSKEALPPLNSKAIDKYCDHLMAILNDEAAATEAFLRAEKLLESVHHRLAPWREPPQRTRAFTEALAEGASAGQPKSIATMALRSGVVKWFSDVRGYGFVTAEDGSEPFVHFGVVARSGRTSLAVGEPLRFSTVQTPRGQKVDFIEPLD